MQAMTYDFSLQIFEIEVLSHYIFFKFKKICFGNINIIIRIDLKKLKISSSSQNKHL